MYPKADVPVVQVSVNPFLSMEKQYEIGKAIREPGREDILVMGSGNKDKPKLLHQSYAYGTLSKYYCVFYIPSDLLKCPEGAFALGGEFIQTPDL